MSAFPPTDPCRRRLDALIELLDPRAKLEAEQALGRILTAQAERFDCVRRRDDLRIFADEFR